MSNNQNFLANSSDKCEQNAHDVQVRKSDCRRGVPQMACFAKFAQPQKVPCTFPPNQMGHKFK